MSFTNPVLLPDIVFGGFPPRTDRHVLAGTITIDGVGAVRRVAVINRKTLKVVAVTTSLTDGSWKISGTNEYEERSLFAIAFDDEGNFNAEVADFISQVAVA